MAKIEAHVEPSDKEKKQKQHQAKLNDLADRKVKSKLTLEDLDAKLDILLEMLGEETR